METYKEPMPRLRDDLTNRFNKEGKEALGTRLRLAFGIGLGICLQGAYPKWLPLFSLIYALYFIDHVADRILFKQRLCQIGNEVAIMAFAKKLELWDYAITAQVNEYLDHNSLDIPMDKLWGRIRGRDW